MNLIPSAAQRRRWFEIVISGLIIPTYLRLYFSDIARGQAKNPNHNLIQFAALLSRLVCMFQDSVPDGSYNDPFLSSVCARRHLDLDQAVQAWSLQKIAEACSFQRKPQIKIQEQNAAKDCAANLFWGVTSPSLNRTIDPIIEILDAGIHGRFFHGRSFLW